MLLVVIDMKLEAGKFRRIRDLREDKDIPQREIAQYLGVVPHTYSRYETETVNLPVGVVIKLAAFHNTSVDYLLGVTDDPTPYPRAKGFKS